MSAFLSETSPTTDEPLANLLFDYPGADVILRSQDAHHFRVSPVLSELIRNAPDPPSQIGVP
jgi:hypothetical protein